MADAVGRPVHPGLILGAARFFHDPRGSIRGVLDSGPSEGRLLAYALIAAAIVLAGRVVQGAATPGDPMGGMTAQIVSGLFFVPLAYYGLAAIGTVFARAFGGKGGWWHGRTAFFWASLVSSPLMLASLLAPFALTHQSPVVVGIAAQIGPVFFAWALSQCFAEAFGFRRALVVLAVIAAPVLFLVVGVWLLRV